MYKTRIIRFILLFSFFASFLIHAAKDSYVTDWAQQLLIDTLSASYLDTPADIESVQKNYSSAAWDPMIDFFDNERQTIQLYKLTLHPVPLNEPVLSEMDNCGSARCWRVNQTYNLPELHLNIDFSLFIVNSANGTPLLVQSLDMKVHRY